MNMMNHAKVALLLWVSLHPSAVDLIGDISLLRVIFFPTMQSFALVKFTQA